MISPDDIRLLFQSGISPTSFGDVNGEDDDEALPEPERLRRVTALKEVLTTAQQHWLSGSEELDLVAEKLGDGSRDGTSGCYVVG